MADQGTMAAYAAHIERYRKLVTDQGGNRRLGGFMARLKPGDAVLDFGCGVGDSAAAMRDAGLDVSCVACGWPGIEILLLRGDMKHGVTA